jgi:hypothetical protein
MTSFLVGRVILARYRITLTRPFFKESYKILNSPLKIISKLCEAFIILEKNNPSSRLSDTRIKWSERTVRYKKKNVVASTEIYINVFDVLSKHFFIFRLKKYKKVGDNPFDLDVFHAYHLGATAFC